MLKENTYEVVIGRTAHGLLYKTGVPAQYLGKLEQQVIWCWAGEGHGGQELGGEDRRGSFPLVTLHLVTLHSSLCTCTCACEFDALVLSHYA